MSLSLHSNTKHRQAQNVQSESTATQVKLRQPHAEGFAAWQRVAMSRLRRRNEQSTHMHLAEAEGQRLASEARWPDSERGPEAQ
jgi:hypothetical protein